MSQEMSRRAFLRTATGLVAADWGGLRIFAGLASAIVQSAEAQHAAPLPEQFIYGAEFFRPPNPPRALRHEMLKAIANEYKFNIIRIYCSLVYLNPNQGVL